MKVKTKQLSGDAIQYTGRNIKQLQDKFGITYKELNSTTYYQGESYKDIRIYKDSLDREILVGDWLIQTEDDLDVIPMFIFEEYWEIG